MTTIVFNAFRILFRLVGILLLGGMLTSALLDIQKRAFDSRHRGLVSMKNINEQLVGKTKWLPKR